MKDPIQRLRAAAVIGVASLLGAAPLAQATAIPVPADGFGWRSLVQLGTRPTDQEKQTIRQTVSMDWDRLEQAWELLAPHGGSFLVLRDGWIVGEFGSQSSYSIASCTKSVTAFTMQRLFDMSDAGALPKTISEDDPAHLFLPAVWSLGDPAKTSITLRQLMTMSSGLEPDDDPYKHAAYRDSILSLPVEDPPDTRWVYASAPVDLLSLVVEDVTGGTLASFFDAEIAPELGLEGVAWASMGSSTIASSYCAMTARDLARIAHCVLRDGAWDPGSGPIQVVSSARARALVRPFDALPGTTFGIPNSFTNDPSSHLRYAKLFWTHALDTDYVSSAVPAQAFYMAGFGSNFCVVVPLYDLIVVRLGFGPRPWDDDLFVSVLDEVMEGVLDRQVHARVWREGSGCGPGTPPVLHATPPRIGDTWEVLFPDLPSGAVHALYHGWPAPPGGLPFGQGCSLALTLPHLGRFAMAPGQELWTINLADNPGLVGIDYAFQALVVDPSLGTFLSNGVQIELGY
jgi:CubicO group peptidase (beta-lactamase class C family)